MAASKNNYDEPSDHRDTESYPYPADQHDNDTAYSRPNNDLAQHLDIEHFHTRHRDSGLTDAEKPRAIGCNDKLCGGSSSSLGLGSIDYCAHCECAGRGAGKDSHDTDGNDNGACKDNHDPSTEGTDRGAGKDKHEHHPCLSDHSKVTGSSVHNSIRLFSIFFKF